MVPGNDLNKSRKKGMANKFKSHCKYLINHQ